MKLKPQTNKQQKPNIFFSAEVFFFSSFFEGEAEQHIRIMRIYLLTDYTVLIFFFNKTFWEKLRL